MSNYKCIINIPCVYFQHNGSNAKIFALSQNEEIIKRKPIKRDNPDKTLYKVYERTMKDTLGTKVSIGTNKITINFNSNEDLNRLLEIMNIKVGE